MSRRKNISMSLSHSIVSALLYLSLNMIYGLPLKTEDTTLWVIQKRSILSHSHKPPLTRRAFGAVEKSVAGGKDFAAGKGSAEGFTALHTTVGVDFKNAHGSTEFSSPTHTAKVEDLTVIDRGNQVLGGHSANGPYLAKPLSTKDGNSVASKWLANANPVPVKTPSTGRAPPRGKVLSLVKEFEVSRSSQASPTRNGFVKSMVKNLEANQVPKVPDPAQSARKKSVSELASQIESPKSPSAVPKTDPAAETVIKDLGKKYGSVIDWKTSTKQYKAQPQTPAREIATETERTSSVRQVINRINAQDGLSGKEQAKAQVSKPPQKSNPQPEPQAPIQLVKTEKPLSTADNPEATVKANQEAKVLADLTNTQAPVGFVKSRVKDISDVSPGQLSRQDENRVLSTFASKDLNKFEKGHGPVKNAPAIETEPLKKPAPVQDANPVKVVEPVNTVEPVKNVESLKPVSEVIGFYNNLAKDKALNSKTLEKLPVKNAEASAKADKKAQETAPDYNLLSKADKNEVSPIAGALQDPEKNNQVEQLLNHRDQLLKGESKGRSTPQAIPYKPQDHLSDSFSHFAERYKQHVAQEELKARTIKNLQGIALNHFIGEFAHQARSWRIRHSLPQDWQTFLTNYQKKLITFNLAA